MVGIVGEQHVPGAGGSPVSRRDALKRGAVIGGTLVWTVPVVQAVSMTAAHAESASAPPRAQGGSPGQPGAGAGSVAGELPHTGSSVPVLGSAVVGAGLVATGVAATVVAAKVGAAKAAEVAIAAPSASLPVDPRGTD